MTEHNAPESRVRMELADILRQNEGQLGMVFELWNKGIRRNKDFVAKGAAANAGAAGNSRAAVEAIMGGVIPNAPTVAAIAKSAVNGLVRKNPKTTKATQQYLNNLIQHLAERADDQVSREIEERELTVGSEEIQKILGRRSGVYVYTFPMCLRNVKMIDPDRWLYKIGKSDSQVLKRIKSQTTGMPESPFLLRVYTHKSLLPLALEKKFHRALLAAGHESIRTLDPKNSLRSGPKEWFATRLEFLDEIAELMGCEVLSARTVSAP